MVVVPVLGVHGCQGPQPAGALAGDGGGDHGVLLAAGGQGLVAGVQAASISRRRAWVLPVFVMGPWDRLVPEECSEGTRPR